MNQIKFLFLTSCMLLLANGALAQSEEDRFSIGPRVGVNFAKLVGDDAADVESNARLVVGLTSTYSFNVRTGLTIDLLYSGEGSKMANGNDLALDYIRVPVFFDLFFRDLGDRFRPKIYAGLAPGFLLDAEVEDNEVKDAYNTFDLAAGAGLGFNFRILERGWLNTDFRYLRGLTGLLDNNDAASVYNQGLQLSVGLAFGL